MSELTRLSDHLFATGRRAGLLLLWLLLGSISAWAGNGPATPSLATALNPDGSLRAGASGSFDARHFTMTTAPNGRPVFRPAAARRAQGTGDENWQDGFGIRGVDGTVQAVVQVGTDTYVAGGFTVVGNVVANRVAKWNGSTWSSLGTGTANGVGGTVNALAVDGSGNVYVGGSFAAAGGNPASRVAKWNGTAWSSLGSGAAEGVGNTVNALAVRGTDLYVGGTFTAAGGALANRIAKWNGSVWSSLGSGTTATDGTANGLGGGVNTLVLDGSGTLYAGGVFTASGGTAARYVAKWNGTAWSALGSGTTATNGTANGLGSIVNALALDGSGNVYAAGFFTTAGGTAARYVARWNGSLWSALGSGTTATDGTANGVNSLAYSLAVSGSNVYVGGLFSAAGGLAASRVARWNGSTWASLGSGSANGVNSTVNALALNGTNVLVGGAFALAGGNTVNRVARWDGTAWNPLGTTTANGVFGSATNDIRAVAVSGTDVYVGGPFTQVGTVVANYVAKWNGTAWSSLGTGPANGTDDLVEALAVSGTTLYAGGRFLNAGGNPASHVARWNGTAWSPLGTGITDDGSGNTFVFGLAATGTTLYAGGQFAEAGGVTTTNVARWNGSAWGALGSGADEGVNGPVNALALRGTDLFLGGGFSMAGLLDANRVARWDGSAWSSLGTGTANGTDLTGYVEALVVNSTDVFIGGTFTEAGGNPANQVARWNGTAWSSLGSGPANGTDGRVQALALNGSDLYIGGEFTQAGGAAASRIAKWNGTAWTALGTGLNGTTVFALGATPGGNVYAGGPFTAVGDGSKVSYAFAVYEPVSTAFTVTGFSPANAAAGEVVTISGTNLTGATGVRFGTGALALRFTVVNAGTITAVVPVAAASGVITVSNATATASSLASFTYTPALEALVSLSPAGPLSACTAQTLTAAGTRPGFAPGGSGFNNSVWALAVQADAKVLAGGYFTQFNGTAQPYLARLNANGTLDNTFSVSGAGLNNNVYALLAQPDGKTLVGGAFGGFSSGRLLRLNADGSVDASFGIGSGFNGVVWALALQPDGKILVGGTFGTLNGAAVPTGLVRLNANGTRDTSFNPGGAGVNGGVLALALQANGKIVAGGEFGTYNGGAVANLLRVNADGTRDLAFDSTPAGIADKVWTVAVQPDGKVLAGGSFVNNATIPDHLVRLTPTGALDNTFNYPGGFAGSGYNNVVWQVNVLADGKILVGSSSNNYNGATVTGGLLRLTAAGLPDNTFNSGGTGFGTSDVFGLALQADGKVLAGGSFVSYNGVAAAPDRLVRLQADGALNATATALTGATFTFSPGGSTANPLVTSTAGSYTATATVGSSTSAPSSAVVLTTCPAPTLTSFTPTTGAATTSVQLTGTNFIGATAVAFNGTAAPGFVVNSATQITVPVPAGASTGTISVTTAGGTATSAGSFTVPSGTAPVVVSVSVPAAQDYKLGQALAFTVVFDAPVTLTGSPTLGLLVGAGTVPAAYQAGSGTATLQFSRSVAGTDLDLDGIALGTLALNGGTIASAGGTAATLALNGAPATNGIRVDGIRPYVASSSRLLPAATTATGPDVTFRVVFNEAVTGVAAASFAAASTGGVGGTVSTVLPVAASGGTTYDVTLTGINGNGTVQLAAPGTGPTVRDLFLNDYLASASVAGQTYTIVPGDLAVTTPQSVGGIYNTVTVGSGGTATLTGPLVVNVGLTVSGGGTLDSRPGGSFGRGAASGNPCNAVTGPGTFTLEPGAAISICDPAGLSSTGATGLIQVTGTRTYSDQARYFYDGDTPQTTGPGLPATVRELALANPAGLTLSQDVAISQALRLGGGAISRAGRSLTLLSEASGTALVDNTGGGSIASGTGSSRMQRYIDPTLNPGAGYRHFSSPLLATPLSQLNTAGFTLVAPAGFNTSATPRSFAPFPNVMLYDQARLGTSPATDLSEFDKGWYVPTTGLTPGQGLDLNIAPPARLTFAGDFNLGAAVSVPLARGPQAEAGWAFIGNPFPAPFDLNGIGATTKANVEAAVYVFESSAQYSGSYRAFVNGVGNGPQVIAAGQGFFVRAGTGMAASSFQFNAAGRVTAFAAQPTFRRTGPDLRPQVALALQAGRLTDNVFVYAESGATAGADAAFDAHKLPNPGNASVWALGAGSTPLAIQGLPALAAGTTVPLTLALPAAGAASFTATLSHLPAGLTAFLTDAVTGTRQNLTTNQTYNFTAPAGTVAGRFALVFGPASGALGTAAAQAAALSLYPNPARNAATLLLPAAAVPRPVLVLDVVGREVRRALLPAQASEAQFDLTGLPAGVYTVRCGLATARLALE